MYSVCYLYVGRRRERMEEGVAHRGLCNRMHLFEPFYLPALATVKTDICLSSTEPSPLYLLRFVERCAKPSSLCVSPTVSSCFYFYLFLRKKDRFLFSQHSGLGTAWPLFPLHLQPRVGSENDRRTWDALFRTGRIR